MSNKIGVKDIERRILVSAVGTVRLRKRKQGRRDDAPEKEEDDDAPPPASKDKGDPKEEEKGEDDQEDKEEEEPKEESEDEEDGKEESQRDDNSPGTVEGYAAVFHDDKDPGTEYELWSDPGFRATETIARGAFSRALKEGDDCRACFNHDPNQLIGRTASGTLRLSEDERGLRYENDLPDTTVGRDVAEMIGRGDVTGSSFGFVVEQESWRESDLPNGQRLAQRTIESVRLLDVGPVTYPAYSATSAGAAGRSALGTVRALGSVQEARDSYARWKEREQEQLPLEARIAQMRARAVAVQMAAE